MKFSFSTKLISCILTLVLLFTASGATLVAAAEETSGKYVKDVFIAYGEKKEDAEKWLRDHGWEPFTDRGISLLNERQEPIVFLLWGANAKAKKALITNPRHLVLEAPHPSPLSAYNGFFGCRHFSKCNAFLEKNGMKPVEW